MLEIEPEEHGVSYSKADITTTGVNEDKKLVCAASSASQMPRWVEAASELQPAISH